ncbi:carbohydrate ABC transporter permease [Mesotoga sp. H07.pep.5.3]|uniref:carbohydrate ABC transporter permease n=1 Tax=Mesotoga sp. H07.pep.5.3 TaxID=1421003 RepID=UPI000C1A3784|nr:carbohydrate ABC transporter permease [Mesotoga sp. H07.pep.5.3]PIJ63573.1 ABC transporter permease [Mesotoga sp. H07.pep.5.3]
MVKRKSPFKRGMFIFAILLLCFFILIPFYFMIHVSLKADYDPNKLTFSNFTVRNYLEIFGLIQSSETEFFGDEIIRANLEPVLKRIEELEERTASLESYTRYVHEIQLEAKEKELRDIVDLVIDFTGIEVQNREEFIERAITPGTEETEIVEENMKSIFSANDVKKFIDLREEVDSALTEESLLAGLESAKAQLKSYEAQKEKIIEERASEFPFLRYLRNSLVFAGISALISLIVAIFGAYAFSRLRFKGRSSVQRSVLFVYLFGGTVIMVPLYQMAVKLGILATPLGTGIYLIMVYVIQTLPVSLYMLGNYFRTIPFSIEEAAIIDGCSRIQAIFKIVIPLSLPAIVTVYIYAFMIGWNEYLFASAFLGLKSYKDLFTLPIGLNAFSGSAHAVWGRLMAASVVSAVPIIIIFSLMQKYLTSGFTAGGVKE